MKAGKTAAAVLAVLLSLGLAPAVAQAADHAVSNSAQLSSALGSLVDGDTITLGASFTHNSSIRIDGLEVTLVTNGFTLTVDSGTTYALTVDNAAEWRTTGTGEFNLISQTTAVIALAGSRAQVTNATASLTGALARGGGLIELSGDLTSSSKGAVAEGGGKVIVEGTITAPTPIELFLTTRTLDQSEPTTSRPGYWEYTEAATAIDPAGQNYVWVAKAPALSPIGVTRVVDPGVGEGATLLFDSTKAGSFHWVCLSADAAAPTAAEVVATSWSTGVMTAEPAPNFIGTGSWLAPDTAYVVYIVGVDANDKLSDLLAMPIPAKAGPDQGGPVLSSLGATRTGEATATVKFDSTWKGTYYYQVDGAKPTVAELVAAGTADTTKAYPMSYGLNTIDLAGLSSGVHTIYIAGEDIWGTPTFQTLDVVIPDRTTIQTGGSGVGGAAGLFWLVILGAPLLGVALLVGHRRSRVGS